MRAYARLASPTKSRPPRERLSRANAEAVVAGGGDGTVSAVASILAGTPVPLGVLPLGTLNHFAKDLGIPLDLQKPSR